MTNSNRIKLTWISFFSYALTGALVIVTGMVMGNIADYFHLPVSSMSNTFTFLNAGILISIFLNAWLMEIVPLKTQLRFGFILMVLAVAGLMLSHSLALFSASMFVLGLVSGITMSIGTFLITHMYEGRQRGARLLFTDSFFSMAGMIFPMVAAVLLARSIEWYWVYACIGLVYVAIFVLTFGCDFPVLGKKAQSENSQPVVKEKWGIGVLFLSVAALCYILGQLGFISWVPEYAKSLGMSLGDAGKLVSDFWMSYMIGMWSFSFILRFFDPAAYFNRSRRARDGADVPVYQWVAGAYAVVYSHPGLLLQRHLHLDHYARFAADAGRFAEAGELYPHLRHHRHHAYFRGHRPDCGGQRSPGRAAHR